MRGVKPGTSQIPIQKRTTGSQMLCIVILTCQTRYYRTMEETTLITVFYRVQCTYKYSAHLNFTLIFWQKNYFCFSKIISKEIIIANLIVIKAILNPFSAAFNV
jgi:hypothetical protein